MSSQEPASSVTAASESRTVRFPWLPYAKIGLLIVLMAIASYRISHFFLSAQGQDFSSFILAQFQSQPEVFDLEDATVNPQEIFAGGPPKDGIPALSDPRFVPAAEASFLRPNDRVIGMSLAGEARAYPLKILNYHEIVNDRLGDTPVAVTYCPLCDSAAAFDRRTPLGEREFGVSGLLYNSNVLMYDRRGKPDSLWSQLKKEGITGPASHKSLTPLPLEMVTWKEWTERHPRTQVLSIETGHQRDYHHNPYGGYFEQHALMFPAEPQSTRLPPKQRVLGVWSGETYRAYPESSFDRERSRIADEIDGKAITIEFQPASRSLRVVTADEGVHWLYSLWFAWYAFYPETTVYEPVAEVNSTP